MASQAELWMSQQFYKPLRKPLIFIIVIRITFYSPVLDYKQVECGICVSVICDLLKELSIP